MTMIDPAVLENVTGGVDLAVCRYLSRTGRKLDRAGWNDAGGLLHDESADCRAAYRAGHPGVANAVRSWF